MKNTRSQSKEEHIPLSTSGLSTHDLKPAPSAGFSLIELVCVLAGVTLLASIAATTIQDNFDEFENEETQAHLNRAANECLKTLGSLQSPERINSKNLTLDHKSGKQDPAKNKDYPYLIDAIDERLLEKNGYRINAKHNNCFYFQIDPIDSISNRHPSIGFGIHNGKVTKFGISPKSEVSSKSRDACERWAGDKCVNTEAQSYDNFFTYMTNYKYNREMCELSFRKKLTKTPQSKTAVRWDGAEDQICNNKQPVQNNDTSYKTNCSPRKCNKTAYIFDGKFTGYTKYSQDEAQSTACSANISRYTNQDIQIKGAIYNGEAIEKIDIPNCTEPVSICRGSQFTNPDEFKECEIDTQVARCKIDLNRIRENESGGPFTVGESTKAGESDLSGLPPCGKQVWIKNKVVYYEDPNK